MKLRELINTAVDIWRLVALNIQLRMGIVMKTRFLSLQNDIVKSQNCYQNQQTAECVLAIGTILRHFKILFLTKRTRNFFQIRHFSVLLLSVYYRKEMANVYNSVLSSNS